jgi:hypothetical protein
MIHFLPIPDPGSMCQKGTGSRIRNTAQSIFSRGQALGRLVCTKDHEAEAVRGRAVLPHTGDIRRRAEIQR